MVAADARVRQIRVMAQCLTALTLAVVFVSALMRLDGAGLGCADWPACYGQVLSREPEALHFGIIRMLHRIFATCSLLLGIGLVWRCLRPRPIKPAAVYASLLLLLMLALSVLGFWSADPRWVLIGFLNIMGGFGLVSFSWRVVLATTPTSVLGRPVKSGRMLRLGVALLGLTILLGAWMGASYAAVACVTLPNCGGSWWPSVEAWAVFNPLLTLTAAPLPGDPGGVALHLLHRYLAVATVVMLGLGCLQAAGQGNTRKSAWVVLLLLLVELGLGGLSVRSGLNLWLVVSHGVCTALLLMAVSTLLRQQRGGTRSD